MDLKTIQEQRNAILREMQTLALGKMDSEVRGKFDAMKTEADTLEGDINRLEVLAKFEAEQRKAVRPNRSQPVGDAIESSEITPADRTEKEKRAFKRYIQWGASSLDAEARSMLRMGEYRDVTTGTSSPNGASLVPQAFYPVLTEAQKFFGPISTVVGQKKTPGNGAPMKISLVNDTGNALSLLGETTAVSELDPAFSSELLSTDTMTTQIIKVSIQELQDSYFDLDSWIRDAFGKRYGRGLEQTITAGNGSNVASLITAYSTSPVAAVGNGTAAGGTNSGSGVDGSNSIGYSDITAMFTALDPAYISNATWTMNSSTRGYLLGVKNTFGQPLFVANPSSGAFDTLLGRPVVLNQSMANIAANAYPIQFGDFNAGYLFRTADDLAIIRLDERYMDQLEVGFIGYCRIGGISLNAGIAPIVNLKNAAS